MGIVKRAGWCECHRSNRQLLVEEATTKAQRTRRKKWFSLWPLCLCGEKKTLNRRLVSGRIGRRVILQRAGLVVALHAKGDTGDGDRRAGPANRADHLQTSVPFPRRDVAGPDFFCQAGVLRGDSK